MDRDHRNKIDKYCDSLVPKINLERLLPKLIDNRVYFEDDVNINRWKKRLNDIETVKDVFLTIKTRGPDAFRNLLLSLRQSGHEHLAVILSEKSLASRESKVNSSNKNDSKMTKVNEKKERDDNYTVENYSDDNLNDSYYKVMQTTHKRLRIDVRKATFLRDGPIIGRVEIYPMRSNPRGLVLIVNNVDFVNLKNRNSSTIDEENLDALFTQMGFRVAVFRNLTGKEMKKTFKDFASKSDFNSVHSFFAIVCSHGSQATKNNYYCTEIQCTDWNEPGYEMVTDTDITNNFTTKNCLELAGKPKVFIFQTCRGFKKQDLINRSATDGYDPNVIAASEQSQSSMNEYGLTQQDIANTFRDYSDTLVAYSTIPGHVSYRDSITGSWFINVMCEVFMNYAHELHLQDLFNLVDSRLQQIRGVHGQCQTLVYSYVGFNKHCYLNPGFLDQH